MPRQEKQKTKKIRLSIPLSEEIYNQIEKDAEIVGVSMATYAAMIIGNHYKTQQISLDYAQKNLIEALRGVVEPLYKTKNLNYDEIAKEEQEKAIRDTLEAIPKIIKDSSEK